MDNQSDQEKLKKIGELYNSLSDDGKNQLVARLTENQDIMGRLLDLLMDINDETELNKEGPSTYIDFLRRVKE